MSPFEHIQVIILAAGRGTRLHPYTTERPKCLATIAGRSLIERQLDVLRRAGLTQIAAATGYRHEMLNLPGLHRVHNADWATTNMVVSLFAGAEIFGDDLIVSYGDILYEDTVLNALLESTHNISVVIDLDWRTYWQARSDDPLGDAESLRLDGSGRIIEIGGPIKSLDEPQGQYIGLMRFHGDGISQLRQAYAELGNVARPWMEKRNSTQAYMTDLLMELILRGASVHGVPVRGGWLEVDTTEDLVFAEAAITPAGIDRTHRLDKG